MFPKVCNRKPSSNNKCESPEVCSLFCSKENKASTHPWPTELHFMFLLMCCKAFFHINLKLYIQEIPTQQKSTACVSVRPSAITRMCNYNLAQVKFNQSPQTQRNLLSQEKGGGGEREREEEIKGGKGEGERTKKNRRASLQKAQGSFLRNL